MSTFAKGGARQPAMDGNNKRPKIFFLGAGRIAVPVLAALAAAPEVELVGVATGVDRPAGRNRKPTPTPVGEWAAAHGLEPLKPSSVNSPDFIAKLRELGTEMIFLVSFGQLLKRDILALPPLGCVNLHASLLPTHRGASPIASAILNGDAKTGVTFMRMEAGLDCGPVYLEEEFPLSGDENVDWLEDQLGALGAAHAAATLLRIASGELAGRPQDHAAASYAGKIHKADGDVDWREGAASLARKVRAYHPWPGMNFAAGSGPDAKRLRIAAAAVADDAPPGEPGQIVVASKSRWVVACGEGSLELLLVVPEGKKAMSGADFLRGANLKEKDLVLTLP